MRGRYFILLGLVYFGNTTLHSQNITDTLQWVNQLHKDNHIPEAENLLIHYCEHHPKDLNAIWLYAKTEYWQKNFNRSQKLYEQAINIQPANAFLQLDYARMLVSIGKYRKAYPWLNKLKTYEETKEEAKLALAQAYYYEGNISKASKEIKAFLHEEKDNVTAKNIQRDITISGAPWLQLGNDYHTDTQPLRFFKPSLETGLKVNCLFSPQASLYIPIFMKHGGTLNAAVIMINNKSSFSSTGTTLTYGTGMVKYPYRNATRWLGVISLNQKLTKHLSVHVEKELKPYFNTLSSIDTLVMSKHFGSSLNLNNPQGFSGKIAYDRYSFDDHNYVYSAYAYLLAPPLKFSSKVSMMAGYSFVYSDSKVNRCRTTQSVSEIVATYVPGAAITGYYNPYFTPKRQNTHALILFFTLQPNSFVKLNINLNAGVVAYSQIPYFFLQGDSDGKYILMKDYAKISVHPMEATASLSVSVNQKINLNAYYTYRNTFFYRSNLVGCSIVSKFWK